MKGYRFYIEYASARDKRRKVGGVNCIAVYTAGSWLNSSGDECVVAFGAMDLNPGANTYCTCWTNATVDYIRLNCTRVSEQVARSIHPALFWRLFDDMPIKIGG